MRSREEGRSARCSWTERADDWREPGLVGGVEEEDSSVRRPEEGVVGKTSFGMNESIEESKGSGPS